HRGRGVLDDVDDLLQVPEGVRDQLRALFDLAGAGLHRRHRVGGLVLDGRDQVLDVLGRLADAAGQRAHLVGDDREAAPLLPGAPACVAGDGAVGAGSDVGAAICRRAWARLRMLLPLWPSSSIFSPAASTVWRICPMLSMALPTASFDCLATLVASMALEATCWIDVESSVTAAADPSIFTASSLPPAIICSDPALLSADLAP